MKSPENQIGFVVIFMLVLLILLLSGPARSQTKFETNPNEPFGHYDVQLRKSQSAPFDGVLVPEDMYRYYHSEVARANFLTDEVISLRAAKTVWKTQPFWLEFLKASAFLSAGYCVGKMASGEKCF